MAANAKNDDKFRFYATAGTLKPPNAAYRNSLGGPGIVVIRADHFWAASYGKHLTPIVGGSFQVSLRELAYVHMPHLVLSAALSAMPLPWYFELSWLATHLWRLHRVGMVAKEFDTLEELRDYVASFCSQLPAKHQLLDTGDVHAVPATSWLAQTCASMLVGHDRGLSRLVDFLAVIPDAYAGASHANPAHQQALSLLASGAAAGNEAVFSVMALRRMASTDYSNEALRKFIPYDGILAEVMRRLEPSASARFAALFDRHHSSAYPLLSHAFPDAAAAGQAATMRRLAGILATGLGIAGEFSDDVASILCARIRPLLPQMRQELQPSSSAAPADDSARLANLLVLHKNHSGGRLSITSSAEPDATGERRDSQDEKYDELCSQPEYDELYTRVQALAATNFDPVEAVLLLAASPHLAGLVFLTTKRSIQGASWSSLASLRDPVLWQRAFNSRLGVDHEGRWQARWGDMLPTDRDGRPIAAKKLMHGLLAQIGDFYALAHPRIRRIEGLHTADAYPLLASPDHLWTDVARLELAEEPLKIIMALIGHSSSRSVAGSWRHFFATAIRRARNLSRVPDTYTPSTPRCAPTSSVAPRPHFWSMRRGAPQPLGSHGTRSSAACFWRRTHRAGRSSCWMISMRASLRLALTLKRRKRDVPTSSGPACSWPPAHPPPR